MTPCMEEIPTAPDESKVDSQEVGEPGKKSAWKSRTVWLNFVAVLAAFVPTVQEWLAENPVEVVSALAALNILVRFVTSGKVSLFATKAASLLLVMGLGGLAAISLTSCQGWGVSGSVHYRDEETGAKGGLALQPGRWPRPWVRVPIESGAGAGWVDLRSGK